MPKIVTVQGATSQDEVNRFKAIEILNDLDTIVLERMAKLSKSPKALSYFKSSILYGVVEAFLNK